MTQHNNLTSIEVTVEPTYLMNESEPHASQYVWAYRVAIVNHSDENIKLRQRYWKITDTNGLIHEIQGKGVVGVEPVLRPGEKFSYTSGAVLTTPSGLMMGSYEMERTSGERFQVAIPTFSLDSPHERIRLN